MRSLDRFLDETERVGILDQRPDLRSVQAGWHVGIDFKLQKDLTAGNGRELLDNGLDDLMDIPGRPIRRYHHRTDETGRLRFGFRRHNSLAIDTSIRCLHTTKRRRTLTLALSRYCR